MVSMVILNYNDWELTGQYAEDIRSMNIVDHIIIVDNCSPDHSYERLAPLASDHIDVIKTENNGGYARGNNFGIQYLCEHYGTEGVVIISNPDIRVDKTGIDTLCRTLLDNPDLFAVTGLIHNVHDELITGFTWRLPTVPMLFVNSSSILRNILFGAFDYGTKLNPKRMNFNRSTILCDALPGCFFAADLGKWNRLGGFCEKTFLFYEEDILFSKAKQRNMKVALVPGVVIQHLEGVSIRKSLNSWAKRERLLEDSCVVYMKEIYHSGRILTELYRVWNRICLPERYFMMRIKGLR